jgi:hypothetical protein
LLPSQLQAAAAAANTATAAKLEVHIYHIDCSMHVCWQAAADPYNYCHSAFN